LPNGFAGEIWIGGDGLATGYVDRPELTRERFIRDPYGSEPNDRIYRTGDRGRRRYDGLLECQGRVDHQVKVRGYRIELGEIESVLKEQNQLREVVVIAREMAKHDVRLVAYVVLGQVDGFDAIGALNQLRGVLPEYMIPQACVVLDALPRTPNGKLDRSALPVPTFNEARFDMGKLAPRDVIERRLAVLWTELLGCRQVFVEDSFFQLGGHSLLSVRLIALIRAEWDIELQVLDLLQNPTLERFAALIRERLEGSRQGASSSNYQYLVPLTKHGKKPTLFCIHGAGGGISQFFGMSRYMDEDRPIAAFQAAGVDGKATPHDSIDLMAEEYLRELKAYAPQGPYFLVGFCGGGIIAYEIAQRLVATGDEVRFLALIDAYRPGIHVNYERFKSWSETFRNGGFSALSRRFIQSVKERAHLLYRVIEIAYSRWRGAVIPIDLREFYLIRTYLNATRRHQMKPYPGKLHVFRATETRAELARAAPDLGWTGYAEGGVEMINTPGSHETIVSDSNLEKLALNIRRYLESV
jgi:thioesterase domain-containing protein/acyl carrier protein